MSTELLAFLAAHGVAAANHSDDGLLAHLQGTAALLAAWGARPALCTAGLIHSVYGTESYRATLLPPGLRPRVQALAGVAAELIAYRFGAMEKQSLYANLDRGDTFSIRSRFTGEEWLLSPGEFGDLCDLTVANWLEQRERVSPDLRFTRRAEFEAMRPRLLPRARQALEEAYEMLS